jgi:hypothetical protein
MNISTDNYINNSLSGVQEQADLNMLKGALSMQKEFSSQIIEMIKEIGIGYNIDITA